MLPSETCAQRLKLLADSTRLAVVRCLMQGPASVGAINDRIGIEQSLLSHHLKVLRDAGLVRSERDGKQVIYALDAALQADDAHLNLGCCRLSF